MNRENTPRWMRTVLWIGGWYNLLWGTWVVFAPLTMFNIIGIEPPRYPQIWQCVGMIVGVYGIGYLIAANNPVRHWPIVLVGFLGKVFGPIGLIYSALQGDFPWGMGLVCLTNDLIWWVPFALILWHAFDRNSNVRKEDTVPDWQNATSNHGATLGELSQQRPTLVLFLRHYGCTFCREAIADLERDRQAIESNDTQVALVHMGQAAQDLPLPDSLQHVHVFSDPQAELYRAFELPRGKFPQLLGPEVWLRGFVAAIVNRHGFGKLVGDGFQMPGVIMLHRGKIIGRHDHKTAADRPQLANLAATI